MLHFDSRPGEPAPEGWYSFSSAPGLLRMHLTVHGVLDARIGGVEARVVRGTTLPDGTIEYTVEPAGLVAGPVNVLLHVRQERGWYGGAAIPGPIRLECGKGMFAPCDWSANDGLCAYSGGAWYRSSFSLARTEAAQRVTLDLGDVVATAELRINGAAAGVKVCPPWRFDVSRFVREGENTIEVLVYNTAANQYTGIPTRYRGDVTSGLLGPVTIECTGRAMLTEH